jgi:hypothetical protein
MRAVAGIALAGLTLAVGCTTPRPFDKTDLGKKRIELYQGQRAGQSLLDPEPSSSLEDLLGDAAFQLTQGMDTDRAVQTFVADGASCAGSTCTWEYTVREAAFPCGLPPLSFVNMCIRQPGPRRTFQERYEVTLLAPVIESRADIFARRYGRTLEAVE